MAFGGKKKKAEKEQHENVVITKVAPGENVLYPPKEESALKEIGIALATVVAAVLLVGLIISKKSFSGINNYNYNGQMAHTSYSDDSSYGNSSSEIEEGETQEPVEVSLDDDVIIVERAERVGMSEFSLEEAADYILENSDSRYIMDEEIADLDKVQLSRARNEIYARHGRKFKDEGLQEYFNSKPWYEGTIEPEDFTEDMLNAYEKANVEKITLLEHGNE